jgi:glycosyltransferase involved in cell wall biosynthesis
MPEVAGNAALFINPDSESEIANAMISIALNDELRDNLRLAGKVRVQLFPESSIYEKTAALYSNVLDTI